MISEISCHLVGYRGTLSQAARLIQKPAVQNRNLQALAMSDTSIKSSGPDNIGRGFDASKPPLPIGHLMSECLQGRRPPGRPWINRLQSNITIGSGM
jgi:hypothetical protein